MRVLRPIVNQVAALEDPRREITIPRQASSHALVVAKMTQRKQAHTTRQLRHGFD